MGAAFLCVDSKVEMYELGVPRGCVVIFYLGCRVEFGVVEVEVIMCVV